MSEPAEQYQPETLTPGEVETRNGPLVLDFGTNWCGHCRRAAPLLAGVRARYPQVPYLKIEDGPGRRLGRAFRVKLWPTVVFLQDGREVARLVRPDETGAVQQAFERLPF